MLWCKQYISASMDPKLLVHCCTHTLSHTHLMSHWLIWDFVHECKVKANKEGVMDAKQGGFEKGPHGNLHAASANEKVISRR